MRGHRPRPLPTKPSLSTLPGFEGLISWTRSEVEHQCPGSGSAFGCGLLSFPVIQSAPHWGKVNSCYESLRRFFLACTKKQRAVFRSRSATAAASCPAVGKWNWPNRRWSAPAKLVIHCLIGVVRGGDADAVTGQPSSHKDLLRRSARLSSPRLASNLRTARMAAQRPHYHRLKTKRR